MARAKTKTKKNAQLDRMVRSIGNIIEGRDEWARQAERQCAPEVENILFIGSRDVRRIHRALDCGNRFAICRPSLCRLCFALSGKTNCGRRSEENIQECSPWAGASPSICPEPVSELPQSVNVVAKEHDLIESVLHDQWWNDLTEDKLCELIHRLAPLMKYRRRKTDPILHLNLEDLLANKEWIEFGPEHERMTTKAYREKVEIHIQSLVNSNAVLQKLKEGKEISDIEVIALANLLREQDPFVTEELLRKVYDHKSARFIQFIRHILGLEKLTSWSETVTAAFDNFIAGHTNLTAFQIQFLQMVKTFVLQTGKVERQNLVDAPFTQIHPQGVRGIFKPREIEELIKFTEDLVA